MKIIIHCFAGNPWNLPRDTLWTALKIVEQKNNIQKLKFRLVCLLGLRLLDSHSISIFITKL